MQSAVPVSTLTNYQIDYRRLADSHDYDFSRQDPLNLRELLVLEDGEIFKSCNIWVKGQDLQYFHDFADISFFLNPEEAFLKASFAIAALLL